MPTRQHAASTLGEKDSTGKVPGMTGGGGHPIDSQCSLRDPGCRSASDSVEGLGRTLGEHIRSEKLKQSGVGKRPGAWLAGVCEQPCRARTSFKRSLRASLSSWLRSQITPRKLREDIAATVRMTESANGWVRCNADNGSRCGVDSAEWVREQLHTSGSLCN